VTWLALVEVYRQEVEMDRGSAAQDFQQSEQGIAVFPARNGHQNAITLGDQIEVRHSASQVMQKLAFLKLRWPVDRRHGIAILCGTAHRGEELL
jgi:hypothetical protein